MKHFGKILTLGAALLAGPLAYATPINAAFGVSGNSTYVYNNSNSATFTFLNSPPATFLTSGGTTITPYFSIGDAIGFYSSPFGLGPQGSAISLGSTGVQIATSTEKGETLTFFVTSYTADFIGSAGAVVEGSGYFTETGAVNYAQTNGTFSFSPSIIAGKSTFSANTVTTVAATPEPSSLIMLGTGLVSAAGMLVRRRRIV